MKSVVQKKHGRSRVQRTTCVNIDPSTIDLLNATQKPHLCAVNFAI